MPNGPIIQFLVVVAEKATGNTVENVIPVKFPKYTYEHVVRLFWVAQIQNI